MRAHVQRRDFLQAGSRRAHRRGDRVAAARRRELRAVPPKPAEDDFGYVQFGVTAELVCAAFYRRALAAGDWTRGERRRLALAHEGDTRHLRTLNVALAPQGPVQRSDFEIRFPAKTFSSRERILAQGQRLEKLTVGVYIDGVTNAADPGTRWLLARVLTADARHLAGLAELAGRHRDHQRPARARPSSSRAAASWTPI